MRFITGVFAAFLATASLAAAAECEDSTSCLVGSWACNELCERRGHTAGGSCLPRDGCPGMSICACAPVAKRSGEISDGDAYLEDLLDGVMDKTQFLNAVLQEEPAGPEEEAEVAQPEERGLDKRTICCGMPPGVAGPCCEFSCYHAGHPEGGQCTANNVCTCG